MPDQSTVQKNEPVYWFEQLVKAIDNDDLVDEMNAQEELHSLGYRVHYIHRPPILFSCEEQI